MMIRSTTTHAASHENTERWLLTYADMITLLAAFFLLLYSMSVMSRGKFAQIATSVRSGFHGVTPDGSGILPGTAGSKSGTASARNAAYQNYQNTVANLSRYVEQHSLKGKVQTRADERGVIISIVADKTLFQRGSADVQSESAGTLAQIAKVLAAAPNQVQIEGHTDDLPIASTQFPSNWELSSARAGSVVRWFTGRGAIAAKRFTASGCADTRPLVPNTTEANRARNRRVDIILLKTDTQRELELRRRDETRRVLAESEDKGVREKGNEGAAIAPSDTQHSSLSTQHSESGSDGTTIEP